MLSTILTDVFTVKLFLFAILVSIVFAQFIRRRRSIKLPPGPRTLPLIGNLWRLLTMKHTAEEITSLSDKYGPIMKLKLGPRTAVVLSTFDVIYEAFVTKSDLTIGRPQPIRQAYIVDLDDPTGIIMKDGEKWKRLRRFSLSTLRDFGYGRNIIQEKIIEEQSFISEVFEKAENNVVWDVRKLFTAATSNVICSLVFGHRFDYDDAKFQTALNVIEAMIKRSNFFDATILLDKFKILPRSRKRKADIISTVTSLREFIGNEIKEHKADYDEANTRDYVDAFLKLISEAKSDMTVTEEDMFLIISDLFIAGTETTATSLTWAVMYMMTFPEVQKRCQQEIDQVAESGRPIRLQDKANMPYVEATLLEIQRCGSIVPLGVPHRVTGDFSLRGYRIPKDTIIFSNLYAAHHDKQVFEAPHSFRPERHLKEFGGNIKVDYLIPFSLGPRVCLGEGLARSELFLIFTNLLNQFNFSHADNTVIDLTPTPGSALIRVPQPFNVKITHRH